MVNCFGVPDPSPTLFCIEAWRTLKLWFLSQQEKQRFLWQQVWFFGCSWSFFYLDGAFFVFPPRFLHFLPFRFVRANLNSCLIFYSVFFALKHIGFHSYKCNDNFCQLDMPTLFAFVVVVHFISPTHYLCALCCLLKVVYISVYPNWHWFISMILFSLPFTFPVYYIWLDLLCFKY